jgi:hypothetical protein
MSGCARTDARSGHRSAGRRIARHSIDAVLTALRSGPQAREDIVAMLGSGRDFPGVLTALRAEGHPVRYTADGLVRLEPEELDDAGSNDAGRS